jgi:hypothetical protein
MQNIIKQSPGYSPNGAIVNNGITPNSPNYSPMIHS